MICGCVDANFGPPVTSTYQQYTVIPRAIKPILIRHYLSLSTVGAGAAGCALAARLTENDDVTLLLLEAGGSDWENTLIDLPGLAPANMKTEIDWDYTTEPQEGLLKSLKDGVGLSFSCHSYIRSYIHLHVYQNPYLYKPESAIQRLGLQRSFDADNIAVTCKKYICHTLFSY